MGASVAIPSPPPARRLAYAAAQLPRLTSTPTYKKNSAASVSVVLSPTLLVAAVVVELVAACFASGNIAKRNENASRPPNAANRISSCGSNPFFSASKTNGEQETAPAPHAKLTRLTSEALRAPPISATARFVGGTTRPYPIPRAPNAKRTIVIEEVLIVARPPPIIK